MPGATTRRAIATPLGTDAVSELRLSITAVANAADTDAIYLSGTLAARTALSGVLAGTLYYVTDSTPPVLTEYNGTVWQTVMLAGAWVPVTMVTNIIQLTGSFVPSARCEGDCVRLKGAMKNNTGVSMTPGVTWATVSAGPPSMRPTSPVEVPCSPAGAAGLLVYTDGTISTNGTINNGAWVSLDNITYSLS